MIGAFLSGTTCESLVHKLGRRGPQTTKELLDIATSHASGEEAVGAIFDLFDGKTRWDEDIGEGASNRPAKRKNKKQRRDNSLVAAADRKGGRKPAEGTPNHFKKNARGAMPKPCFPGQASIQGMWPHAQILVRGPQQRGAGEGTCP